MTFLLLLFYHAYTTKKHLGGEALKISNISEEREENEKGLTALRIPHPTGPYPFSVMPDMNAFIVSSWSVSPATCPKPNEE